MGFGVNRQGEAYDLVEEMKSLMDEVEDWWAIECTFHNPGNLTRRLIRDPLMFVRRKRNHYVMQILTGHCIFNYYRHRISKESHNSCWNSGDDLDDAEHVLFKCSRWVVKRTALESEVGVDWKMNNDIVARMVAEDHLWLKFSVFCNRVMKSRQFKEREMEMRGGLVIRRRRRSA